MKRRAKKIGATMLVSCLMPATCALGWTDFSASFDGFGVFAAAFLVIDWPFVVVSDLRRGT